MKISEPPDESLRLPRNAQPADVRKAKPRLENALLDCSLSFLSKKKKKPDLIRSFKYIVLRCHRPIQDYS
jgi:hypothetical protein